MARYVWGYDAMRRAILLVSIGLCGCAADDEFRVLSYTPAGIEYSVWTGAHSREVVIDMAQLSTPEQNCIGLPEQKYISDAGKKGPRTGGLFLRHHAWFGLSAGMSELARRELRLL
jgi:hypothetical protein